MGKKRYYCHFCDKHLADNPQTRKKHNLGLQHCTNKKLHYALFKGKLNLKVKVKVQLKLLLQL